MRNNFHSPFQREFSLWSRFQALESRKRSVDDVMSSIVLFLVQLLSA